MKPCHLDVLLDVRADSDLSFQFPDLLPYKCHRNSFLEEVSYSLEAQSFPFIPLVSLYLSSIFLFDVIVMSASRDQSSQPINGSEPCPSAFSVYKYCCPLHWTLVIGFESALLPSQTISRYYHGYVYPRPTSIEKLSEKYTHITRRKRPELHYRICISSRAALISFLVSLLSCSRSRIA